MTCTNAEIGFKSCQEETLIVRDLDDQFSFSDGADATIYIDKDDVVQLVEFLLAMKGA